MSKIWFYKKDDKEFGPITAKELRALAESNTLTSDDLVKMGDSERWVPARRVSGLFRTPPVDSAVTTDSTEAPAEDRTDTTRNNPTAQSSIPDQPIDPKDNLEENTIQSPASTSTPKPSPTTATATITIADLQQSALLGFFAALPSWLFFGDLLYLLAGGVIVGITMTFATQRLGIDVQSYQSKVIQFIGFTSIIFTTSWLMGTATIPIVSIALLGVIWIAKYYIDSGMASKANSLFSSAWRPMPETNTQNDGTPLWLKIMKAKFTTGTEQLLKPFNNSGTSNTPEGPNASQPIHGDTSPSTPPLWNPITALAWSLIFSWLFAVIIIGINWYSLGEKSRALRCSIWSAPCLLVLFHIFPFNNPSTFYYCIIALLVAFALIEAKPQIRFIQEHRHETYRRRSWLKPSLISAGTFLLATITPFSENKLAEPIPHTSSNTTANNTWDNTAADELSGHLTSKTLDSARTTQRTDAYQLGYDSGLDFARRAWARNSGDTRPFARKIYLSHFEEDLTANINQLQEVANQLRERGDAVTADGQQGAADGMRAGLIEVQSRLE